MFRSTALALAICTLLLVAQAGDSAVRRRPAAPANRTLNRAKGSLRIAVLNTSGKHAGHAHVRVAWRAGGRRHVMRRRANVAGVVMMRSAAPATYAIRASGAHRSHGAASTAVGRGAAASVVIGLHGGRERVARTAIEIERRISIGHPGHHLFALGLRKPRMTTHAPRPHRP